LINPIKQVCVEINILTHACLMGVASRKVGSRAAAGMQF